MQAFNELRQATRERHDKAIVKARDECEATLARIAAMARQRR
jgi:hypothetical protein